MHKIEELRDCLCAELEEYAKKKDNLDMESLETIDKLAHAVKNLDKIIDADMNGYSGTYMMPYSRANYDYDTSGARGRGSFTRRDSMGRYSGGTSMASDIRRLMENAPDDQTRAELGRIAQRYE